MEQKMSLLRHLTHVTNVGQHRACEERLGGQAGRASLGRGKGQLLALRGPWDGGPVEEAGRRAMV